MTARRVLQLFAWACIAAIAVLSLVAPAWRPVTALPHNLEHAAIFAIAGFAAGLGYPNRPAQQCFQRVVNAVAAALLWAGRVGMRGTASSGALSFETGSCEW